MGVDAIMLVKTAKMNKEDVLSLAVDCHEAFGSDVWVSRPYHHCIELVDDDYCWFKNDDPTKSILRVYLGGSGRYYGEGYERGYLHNYIAIAEWIENRLPDAVIYYGGDSGDYVDEVFDKKRRTELFKYYCIYGHKPYTGSFSKELGNGTVKFCDFCHRTMQQNGFSKTGYAAFYCQGCGHSIETHDNGKTYTEMKK